MIIKTHHKTIMLSEPKLKCSHKNKR